MNAVEKGHVFPNHIRHRHEQVRRANHDLNGLVGVAKQRNRRHPGERILATGERTRFAIGLERGHDLLRHFLQVGDFIKGHRIPEAHQAHFVAGDVVEQVGDGRRAGQQDRVRRKLLIAVALTGATRAKFNQVVVLLTQGQQANEKEELHSPLKMRGFHANGAEQQIDPFVGREFTATRPVLFKVEGR